jgi:hypothetical protein
MLQGLADATPEQLARVQVLGRGTAVAWDDPDVGFTVGGMASSVFGTKEWMAELRRVGGSAKSGRKATTSRVNGAKGGRPTKAYAGLSSSGDAPAALVRLTPETPPSKSPSFAGEVGSP